MKSKLRVLALEAYYGGSHQAFLDSWIARSQHEWSVYGLPAYKWKWRMRHAAITFARQLQEAEEARFDLIFCSDMTNLAEFRGLAPANIAKLPAILYFHENQLTYPAAHTQPRDHHYAFTNLISALSADQVWFNSHYHRHTFLAAMREFLTRMPDFQELESVDQIDSKSEVWSPGVEIQRAPATRSEPLHILWAARWEEDKNPDDFFKALFELDKHGVEFRLTVLGESFADVPPIFAIAKDRLSHRIDHWGYVADRAEYVSRLQSADVVVSTAIHEFFGIAVVEAIAAGAIPVLPHRLSYPEILQPISDELKACLFYEETADDLVRVLTELSSRFASVQWREAAVQQTTTCVQRFQSERLVPQMDDALRALLGPSELGSGRR